MAEISKVKCASGFLRKIDFRLERVVHVSFHDCTLGIRFVTDIQRSTAISFFTLKGVIDDVIILLYFLVVLGNI